MSGSEMQREKEKVAAKMREKQAAGKSLPGFWMFEELLREAQPMQRKPQKAVPARRNRRVLIRPHETFTLQG